MRIVTTAVLVSCFLSSAPAQNLGFPPSTSITPLDVYTAFRLPPLRDNGDPALNRANLPLQVIKRAIALKLTADSATDTWKNAAALLKESSPPVSVPAVPIAPQSASELNRILADPSVSNVKLTSDLVLEAPIDIVRNGIRIDFNFVNVSAPSGTPWMIRIRNASAIVIAGGRFSNGASGILVDHSDNIAVADATFQNLRGAGIAVTESSRVRLSRNRLSGISLASVILHRGVTRTIVESNLIQDNAGTSNLTAGILLTDREVDITSTPRMLFGPDGYWPREQPITDRLRPPSDNAVVWNVVATNHSSGIYSDGGVRNVISGNTIRGNAKEGLCLDNGSTANVVAGNTFTQNGQRWGQPDDALAHESVAVWGRLEDGTAAAKLPAISLDNAIYNVVTGNNLEHNFGGGIKMVRTSYFNAIGLNSLLSNNEGESAVFHFFGIELGAAIPDGPATDLDFTPSRGNIVFSNLVRGTHYSGVFLAPGSDLNDLFDNTIMDANHWALESVEAMNNATLNNLTNIESVNIASGLAPAGLK